MDRLEHLERDVDFIRQKFNCIDDLLSRVGRMETWLALTGGGSWVMHSNFCHLTLPQPPSPPRDHKKFTTFRGIFITPITIGTESSVGDITAEQRSYAEKRIGSSEMTEKSKQNLTNPSASQCQSPVLSSTSCGNMGKPIKCKSDTTSLDQKSEILSSSESVGKKQAEESHASRAQAHFSSENLVAVSSSDIKGDEAMKKMKRPSFRCAKCGNTFLNMKVYAKHKLNHNKKFQCWHCPKHFIDKVALLQHANAAHRQEMQHKREASASSRKQMVEGQMQHAPYQNYPVSQGSSLRNHSLGQNQNQSVTSGKIYGESTRNTNRSSIPYCLPGHKTKGSTILSRNTLVSQGHAHRNQPQPETHNCHVCGKVFTHVHHLWQHAQTHQSQAQNTTEGTLPNTG